MLGMESAWPLNGGKELQQPFPPCHPREEQLSTCSRTLLLQVLSPAPNCPQTSVYLCAWCTGDLTSTHTTKLWWKKVTNSHQCEKRLANHTYMQEPGKSLIKTAHFQVNVFYELSLLCAVCVMVATWQLQSNNNNKALNHVFTNRIGRWKIFHFLQMPGHLHSCSKYCS